jgi:putative oxidoreductase
MAFNKARNFYNQIFGYSDALISPALFAVRAYIAWVFFKSGLTKIRDWESTLMLFEYEYQVPVFSPELAAWLATAGELVLPVLLVAGLLTRVSAIGIFIINYVAVISLLDIAPAAFSQHILWGSLIASLMLLGGGKFSADKYLQIK